MAYKFIQTVYGPAVSGNDEVVFFNQHNLLVDYLDEDPEFVVKAKAYLAQLIQETTDNILLSLTEPVLGDPIQPMSGLLNSVIAIAQFEYQFIPNVYRK